MNYHTVYLYPSRWDCWIVGCWHPAATFSTICCGLQCSFKSQKEFVWPLVIFLLRSVWWNYQWSSGLLLIASVIMYHEFRLFGDFAKCFLMNILQAVDELFSMTRACILCSRAFCIILYVLLDAYHTCFVGSFRCAYNLLWRQCNNTLLTGIIR